MSRGVPAHAYTLRVQRALYEAGTAPEPWRDALDLSDRPLRITAAEAVALGEELRAVTERHRRDSPGSRGDAPGGTERVSVITFVLPELSCAEQDAP
ncbi:hypothetical protein AB0910_00760 [Streptomyces sp. NPDC047002]|uniref:hypothetical protein n=1 Tax=Streptomyces sp. NPDC047002 TaxID=3155475 RepID=UPI003454D132